MGNSPPSGQSPWRHATCTRAQAATAKVCLRRLHSRPRPTNVFGLPPRTRPAVKNSYQRQFNFSIYGSCERERAAVRRSPGYQQTLVSCFVSAPNPRSSVSAKPATCKPAERPRPAAQDGAPPPPPARHGQRRLGGTGRWIFIGQMCERGAFRWYGLGVYLNRCPLPETFPFSVPSLHPCAPPSHFSS